MRKNYRPSLRARLTGLVLIAVLPAVGLILYHAGQQRITDSQETKREALRLVRVVASSQERLIDSTRHLLIALAMLREVRSQDKSACDALFARLLKEYPLYSNLGAADTSGEQYCSALPTTAPVSIGDRSYFRLALRRRALAIGDYQIGRITRKPSVNLGYPVIDDAGSVTSVVFAAVDITALRDAAAMVNLPRYAALTIYDRHGTVLARTPEDSLVGRSIPEKHIFKMNLALGEGLTQAAGSDGKQWLFGFTSVRDRSNDPQMLMHIAIPSHIALAHSNGQLKRNLGALLLVTALALAAAWFGGDLFVFRQLRALIGTTERLRAGDLTARTRLPHESNEIGRLAASFDSMADSLERNHREAVATGKRLERNIQRLEALHEIDMALTSTLDLHAVLDLLLEKVDLILPGAVTTIRLISKETGALEPAACRNVSDAEWRAGNPRPMHGFAKLVLENKIPLTVANVQTDPRSDAHRFAHRFGLVSYLGIPLIAKNQPLGLIAFYTKEEHSFTDEEIEFL
ncbi:MAG TPA: cache domain-containing protein, partial [Candidatus Binatia bacterium]|nr:cache domain-containing protein [Candidatus Binatia bacterium]